MGRYVIKRLLLIIPTLFLIMLTNFAIVQWAPGGPVEQKLAQIEKAELDLRHSSYNTATAATSAGFEVSYYRGSRGLSPEMVDSIKAQYGFDRPAHERFWLMLKRYLALDFGTSFFKGEPVAKLILDRLAVSVSLGLWSTLFIYLIAIPLGVYKAICHDTMLDTISAVILAVLHAVPVFLVGVILLVVLAGGSYWQLFPMQGLVSEHFAELSLLGKIKDYVWHLALPLTASTLGGLAGLTYLTKFGFINEMAQPYVLTARAKGLTSPQVLYKHVFRNAVLMLVSGLPAVVMTVFFFGNFLIEIIFQLDGLGYLSFEAVQQRDYPVIFGALFIFTLVGMLVQLIADISYRIIDPRIDFEGW